MHRELNPVQHQCVETIIEHIKRYLELRSVVTIRANPRMHDIWPNLQWTVLTQLRTTLENDKMWGPNRYVIGEVLCGDDRQKIRELFNPTNQVSIQTEVVEKRESTAQTTGDVLEIHDFRTLYGAIEPSVATAPTLMQIYVWWDLPDTCDLSRIDLKAARISDLQANGASDDVRQHYARLMNRADTEAPDAGEIEIYELKRISENLKRFHNRRIEEQGYRFVPAAKPRAACGVSDPLVSELAKELSVFRNLEAGGELDDKLRSQFAKALRVSPENVTSEMAADLLRKKVIENKIKLREALGAECDGDFYNFKLAQAEEYDARFEQLLGGRDLSEYEEETPAMQSGSGPALR